MVSREELERHQEDLSTLRIDFEKLSSRVEEWMGTTTEYRRALCAKMDIIRDTLTNLPCKERTSIYQGLRLQVNVIWAFLTAIILIMVVEYVKIHSAVASVIK